ncbi:low molecular weight phosphatase family protein [Modestobacter sp. VKM Ac-2983]|uniref:arsenate-mycothiol transferase ArsC n=1 Tax=Modestobacter sp. VKM Ac-2983 TaxID=3004137 RepID=UPI0022ABB2A1|nr:low molecular weight phosphatase family protein [Modestobacter sp. VKM Ac-2983]MCZ2807386.1 low molecular weight phosphatase family protein [Modestobacter sp. VKM Ac-2983]
MTGRPSVLFVCARNSGKSQLAAALMADLAGDAAEVRSAGTVPGDALNEQSVRALAELGIDLTGERPRPVTEQLVRDADVVVTLGQEARVEPVPGTRFVTWDVDEPSARGIEGMARMRLVRDDIATRVRALATELGVGPRRQ